MFTLLVIKAMPALIPLLIMAGTAAYNAYSASKTKNQGNKLLDQAQQMAQQNKRPAYNIPGIEWDSLNMLTNNASQGLSDSSRNILSQNADRGLTSSIDAILQGGGSPNNVANTYGKYLDNVNNITLADDQAKIRNIGMLLDQQRRISSLQDKQWTLNQYAPFVDQAANIAQLKGQGANLVNVGNQQMTDAVDTFGSAAASYANGAYMKGQNNNINTDTKSPGIPQGIDMYSLPPGKSISDIPDQWKGLYFSKDYIDYTGINYLNGIGKNYHGIDISKLSDTDRTTLLKLMKENG